MAKRKFGDGGEVDGDYGAMNEGPAGDPIDIAPKKQTFKEAFAAARADKSKTFEWNGKSYSTALASDKKPSTTPPRESTLPTKSSEDTPAQQVTVSGKRPGIMQRMRNKDNAMLASVAARKADGQDGREFDTTTESKYSNKKSGVIGKASDQKFMGYAKGGSVRGWGCAQRGMKCGGKVK